MRKRESPDVLMGLRRRLSASKSMENIFYGMSQPLCHKHDFNLSSIMQSESRNVDPQTQGVLLSAGVGNLQNGNWVTQAHATFISHPP